MVNETEKNREYTALLLSHLAEQRKEGRHLEFKSNYQEADRLGKYISALSNGACLDNEETAFLYFGIEDETLEIKGTTFDAAAIKAEGNQALELYLRQMVTPKIDFRIEEFRIDLTNLPEPRPLLSETITVPDLQQKQNLRIVVFIIPSAKEEPTCYKRMPYIRVDSHVTDLRPYTDWMRSIYFSQHDWSKEIVPEASVKDLDPEALAAALEGFCQRYPKKEKEARQWPTETFLDKAKLTIDGKITRTALLLLGKEESAHHLNGMFQIVWRLRTSEEKAGDIYNLPFILATSKIVNTVRNYRIKIYPDNSLIPAEVWKYDSEMMLEAMHNAIAHADYRRGERIIITETTDQLEFENPGSFFCGSYEDYISGDKTPKNYRNQFLVSAMVNLKMIDTQGYGIHTMFLRQRNRFLPMPDYDLSDPNHVRLIIPGKVIDRNYSLLLMDRTDLTLTEAVLLDKVQKSRTITDDAAKLLRKTKLIEGRKPNYIVCQQVAQAMNQEAEYTLLKGFDDQYYRDLVIKALQQHGQLRREDFNKLLINKLPDVLSDDQKLKKVSNILSYLKRQGKIEVGKGKIWTLTE